MASTNFVNNSTVIYAEWLNDVNNATYNGVFAANTITPSNIVCNGSVSGTGFTSLVSNVFASPSAIGSATPNTGAFTTLTATTPIAVSSGGTGLNTLTANNVLLGNGTSALQKVAPGTSGYALRSTGTTWTSQKLGLGMTGEIWHDVTSSRTAGTTYTNNNSYPISVSISFGTSNDQQWYLYVNGVQVAHLQEHQDFNGSAFSTIVPAGATYLFTGNYLQVWAELY